MKKIGLITDDMTGTMTCGVLLAQTGIRACSFFAREDLKEGSDQEALILNADSRNLSPDQAKARVKDAYYGLKEQGAVYFTKRIDSTFRGGIGYEIDGLLEEMPEDTIAVAAPAMPDTRKILVGGYSVIDGTVLTETGAARDVISPVSQAHIPTLLRSQSHYPVGEVGLKWVLSDLDTLAGKLEACRQKGCRIIVTDGITHAHLAKTAEAVCRLGWDVLCVDPGAFSQKMALCRGFGKAVSVDSGSRKPFDLKTACKKVLAVAGSATDMTRKQLQTLGSREYARIISMDAGKLVQGGTEAEKQIQQAARQCREIARQPEVRIIALETAFGSRRLSLKETEKALGLEPGQASGRINRGLSLAAREGAEYLRQGQQLGGIYMTGGDTLVAVMKALGASGIRLVDAILPQINLGILIGGKWSGLPAAGKGGLVGPEDAMIQAAARLLEESEKRGGQI